VFLAVCPPPYLGPQNLQGASQ